MKNKLVFFDIDGTLLDDNKNLPPSAKKAILQLQDHGYKVAIATGRAPFMFTSLRDELGIDTFISFNGQYVVCENELIYKNPLEREALSMLLDFATEREHSLVFMDHEAMRASTEYHPYIEKSIGTLKFEHPSLDLQYYQQREIFQTLLFCTDEEEHEYMEMFGQLQFVRWHPLSTDILPNGGSKAQGIKKMIEHLGIEEKNVYAFGDGKNDLEMLQFVENSIAMGNAVEEVKEVAKFVTKRVDEDGIFHGLKLVGLL